MEHHAEGELGGEKGEEPLGCIHVGFQTQIMEVSPQVWKLLLKEETGCAGRRRKGVSSQRTDFHSMFTPSISLELASLSLLR